MGGGGSGGSGGGGTGGATGVAERPAWLTPSVAAGSTPASPLGCKPSSPPTSMEEAQPVPAPAAAFFAWLAAAFLAAVALGTTRGTAAGMGAWDALEMSGVPAVAFCRLFLDSTMKRRTKGGGAASAQSHQNLGARTVSSNFVERDVIFIKINRGLRQVLILQRAHVCPPALPPALPRRLSTSSRHLALSVPVNVRLRRSQELARALSVRWRFRPRAPKTLDGRRGGTRGAFLQLWPNWSPSLATSTRCSCRS